MANQADMPFPYAGEEREQSSSGGGEAHEASHASGEMQGAQGRLPTEQQRAFILMRQSDSTVCRPSVAHQSNGVDGPRAPSLDSLPYSLKDS